MGGRKQPLLNTKLSNLTDLSVNSSSHEKGVVMTTTPPGRTSRDRPYVHTSTYNFLVSQRRRATQGYPACDIKKMPRKGRQLSAIWIKRFLLSKQSRGRGSRHIKFAWCREELLCAVSSHIRSALIGNMLTHLLSIQQKYPLEFEIVNKANMQSSSICSSFCLTITTASKVPSAVSLSAQASPC